MTDHRSVPYEWLAATAPLIVDARNAISNPPANVFRLGAPRPADAEMPCLEPVGAV